jgi:ABC-type multidrug transport system ATPase subunit
VNQSIAHIELTSPASPAAGPGSPNAVLVMSSVTKCWPRQQDPVLRDIDLEIGPGALVSLSGQNGAGKTTLLRLVAGMMEPDSGTIRVCGLEAADARREYQRRIGLLSAGSSGLYARMTARQHLEYWSRLALVPREQRSQRIEESIERLTLGALAGRRLDRMSMGQRQRVRVAMAFLHRPALLLLDEPATSLDDDGLTTLLEAVAEHRRTGGSTLWCSPGGEEIAARVDLRLRLASGRLERHD